MWLEPYIAWCARPGTVTCDQTMRCIYLLCVLAGLLGALPAVGAAQADTIVVEVVDRATERPLENVVVQLPDAGIQAITDADGRVRLEGLGRGTYRMILSRPGYEKEEGDFAVLRSGALRIGLQPLDISSDASTGIIVGRVSARGSGEPLSAVTVTLVGTELRAETMSDGLFEIRNVPPGRYVLRAERLGMATREDSIFVPPGRGLEVNVRLSTRPIPLEGFTVTAHSKWLVTSGFFRRQKTRYEGQQWDRTLLEQLRPEILQDVLETVPWVISTPTRGYMYRGRCRMTVFVDDLMMPSWFDVDMIAPDRIEALEVYHGAGSTMPIEYQRYCGVILVWLKH